MSPYIYVPQIYTSTKIQFVLKLQILVSTNVNEFTESKVKDDGQSNVNKQTADLHRTVFIQ